MLLAAVAGSALVLSRHFPRVHESARVCIQPTVTVSVQPSIVRLVRSSVVPSRVANRYAHLFEGDIKDSMRELRQSISSSFGDDGQLRIIATGPPTQRQRLRSLARAFATEFAQYLNEQGNLNGMTAVVVAESN